MSEVQFLVYTLNLHVKTRGVHPFEFANAMHAHLLTGWPKITTAASICMRDDQKASLLYTLIQFTLLMVEKACVTQDVTLRFTACNQVRLQDREPSWL